LKKLLETLRQGESAGTLQMRLLVLLAVDAAACVVTGAAAGAFRFALFNAVVAALSAVSAVVSLPAARRFFTTPARAQATPHAQHVARTKKILLLVMLAGGIAYFGGRATFAIFTAETANPNSNVASGTLTLGNKVNNGTVCMSSSGATQDNVNGTCNVLLSLANMAPGVSALQAKLTIENDGSIDASKFYLSAPYPRVTLNGALTANTAVTSLTVGALNTAVATNDQIRVSYGGHDQTFNASAPAAIGATSISVTSQQATFSFPVGSRVDDTSGNTTASNTDCYDQKTTTSTVTGASVGTDLNFNSPTGNPLCSAMLMWVQEQTNGLNYCWYGRGSAASPAPSSLGMCRTPTSPTLSAALTAGTPITSVPVNALTGNVQQNDSFTITEAGHSDTFQAVNTAAGNLYIGATSIPTASWTPSYAYDSGATITDTTATGALNGDGTDTISNFDTGHPETGLVRLSPLTNNNVTNAAATVWLNKHGDSGYQRTFYIGVYMPAPTATPQNQLQGLVSTFGLNWHIDQ
jgi:hypothetical protein